jgi:hypothetical protein
LKNKSIVNEAENALRTFEPAKIDLTTQMRAVETIETKAVRNSGLYKLSFTFFF